MAEIPVKFIETMRGLLGDELADFCAALEGGSALALRANPARAGAAEAARPYIEAPVPWARGGFYLKPGARPGASIAHLAGAFYLQEASAMMPAAVLDARPGERVLDLCAAPGGKSTQIAAALAGAGLLVANEPDAKRARALAGNLERMGVKNAAVVCEQPGRLAEKWGAAFDAVLVDAPCSGEGMFRREPASRLEWRENAPEGCARRQLAILLDAARLLRSGGRMVYSTCTFNETENEGVVRAFLEARPEFRLAAFSLPGLGAADGMLRVLPHRARGDGQFAALLAREAGAAENGNSDQASMVKPDRAATDAARRFEDAFGAFPRGCVPALWGDALYAVPRGAPDFKGLRVISPGLALARVFANRLEPEHALAMAGEGLASTALSADAAKAFLRGEAVPLGGAGWLVATCAGMPLGWGKASGGVFKNHLPKGLRRAVEE